MTKTKLWIVKATKRHGNRFDYTRVVYTKQDDPIVVGCSLHGEFTVTPRIHIRPSSTAGGCKGCSRDRKISAKNLDTDAFIRKARAVHGNRYDYSKTAYTKMRDDVIIVCPEHGDFSKRANNHISKKQGCPRCASQRRGEKLRHSWDEIKSRIETIHGNSYDLSTVEYVNYQTPVRIRCTIHGDMIDAPVPSLLLGKHVCVKCATFRHKTRAQERSILWPQFVAEAAETHQNKYTYIEPSVFSLSDDIELICPVHGSFVQSAINHRSGKGCSECGVARSADSKRRSLEEFMRLAISVHGDRYDYSGVDCRNNAYKVKIKCPDHGWFWQAPHHHLSGYGCGACSVGTSRGEQDIAQFIKGLGVDILHRYKLDGVEYDINVTDKNILIEYCGNYWHSQMNGKGRSYHTNKLTHALDHGYTLLTIFEDEWEKKSNIVKSRIKNILGLSERGLGARHLDIRGIEYQESRDFLNLYHIQGSTKQMKYNVGAYCGNRLVAVMAFTPTRRSLGGDGSGYELVRFSTDGMSYAGVAGRLLKTFRRLYPSRVIISYADRRWSTGNLYKSLGFIVGDVTPPSYWYVDTKNYLSRKHRSGFQKARVVEKFNADPKNTEWEIMQANGYDRIWDCGNLKFVLG